MNFTLVGVILLIAVTIGVVNIVGGARSVGYVWCTPSISLL